ncbi:hypothetical protein WJX72_008714 [[Myrmecia] bisecta]|uniref:Steroid 5-alpha reductase C-terminal domain-containing protein n=1 Tax=[Myrmecia] bisecta TaxID=41462 RepID=A0AAW1P9W5_9CHLO
MTIAVEDSELPSIEDRCLSSWNSFQSSHTSWCKHWALQPVPLVNLVFFLNVCVLFWAISLVQKSTWLIDIYWTIIPPLIAHFYRAHPAATYQTLRSVVCLALTWVWSIRLTHSYLRREKWQLGVREDWRYADMREQYGLHWWWLSFFLVYLVQQVMLVGVTLPLAAVHSSTAGWRWLDNAAIAVCVTGLLCAYFADNQLHSFVEGNVERKKLGKPALPLLDTGLWRYSRHPNYFGEQLWWWGLGLFAVSVGQPYMLVGALFNSACLVEGLPVVGARAVTQDSE